MQSFCITSNSQFSGKKQFALPFLPQAIVLKLKLKRGGKLYKSYPFSVMFSISSKISRALANPSLSRLLLSPPPPTKLFEKAKTKADILVNPGLFRRLNEHRHRNSVQTVSQSGHLTFLAICGEKTSSSIILHMNLPLKKSRLALVQNGHFGC